MGGCVCKPFIQISKQGNYLHALKKSPHLTQREKKIAGSIAHAYMAGNGPLAQKEMRLGLLKARVGGGGGG